jgi:peptidyl-prolyl cis-trans isomerase A (cyclophilin A)
MSPHGQRHPRQGILARGLGWARRPAVASRLTLVLALVPGACGGDQGDAFNPCPDVTAPEPSETQRVLLQPAALQQPAPDTFRVRFTTSQGDFVMEVVRDWAPIGVQRFYNLVRNGFYDGNRFFRVLPGFVVQFGMSGVPAIQRAWDEQPLRDDPVTQRNVRGAVTFATAGPNTRTTQVFINYIDNANLDDAYAPFGRVVEGMDVLDRLYADYGEGAPYGSGPLQQCLLVGGNAYLDQSFDRLDAITRAVIIE